jgi:O-succinylbenzoate synthase
LGPDAWLDHGVLALQFDTAICLDESIRSGADMRLARHFGAADAINVKPSRVGGVRAAREIVDECVEAGISAWVGGMLDLGINRAVNLAVAALDGCDLPGDISATDRYFDRDITEPFVLDSSGGVAVPQGLGIGVEVDVEAVASYSIESITLR